MWRQCQERERSSGATGKVREFAHSPSFTPPCLTGAFGGGTPAHIIPRPDPSPSLPEPSSFCNTWWDLPWWGVLSANTDQVDQLLGEPQSLPPGREFVLPPHHQGAAERKLCVFSRVQIMATWFYTKQALGGQTRRVNTHLEYCLEGEILLFFSIIPHTYIWTFRA